MELLMYMYRANYAIRPLYIMLQRQKGKRHAKKDSKNDMPKKTYLKRHTKKDMAKRHAKKDMSKWHLTCQEELT